MLIHGPIDTLPDVSGISHLIVTFAPEQGLINACPAPKLYKNRDA
jgi:hypothetical protein